MDLLNDEDKPFITALFVTVNPETLHILQETRQTVGKSHNGTLCGRGNKQTISKST